MSEHILTNQRVTQKNKEANDFGYYKEQVDLLDKRAFNSVLSGTNNGIGSFKRKKINYDLVNNIIDLKDFEYVCKPFGHEVGELPANFTNRDIISGKIKTLCGMQEKRPFSYKVFAINDEATTRIEQEEFRRIRDYVVKSIMDPIELSIRQRKIQEQEGRKLSQQEIQQLEQQIAQETEAMTPDEVRRYISREHQDPAEALAEQLLEYLKITGDLNRKFNKQFKHACISAEEVYHVGLENGLPVLNNVNPLFFDCDKSPDIDFIEDGEWAINEFRMTPSQIIQRFPKLTKEEIDLVYSSYNQGGSISENFWNFDTDFSDETDNTIRVLHATWKGLRKIGFLKYLDVNGKTQEKLVHETYKLNKDLGDLSIEWRWIPEAHEGYKIKVATPIYQELGPCPGQFKDMNNLYNCKLPYVGAIYDNLNSQPTSIVDRLKAYQYYYDIIMYRIELLLASDKGKILQMNINSIPSSAGIDIHKWHYYAEATKVAWVNPNEEGNRGVDTSQINRVLDMSLATDINNYIRLADYIEHRAGVSVGIYKEMEGQISSSQAVTNVQQTMESASNILNPIFELHNYVKRNVLTQLIEVAKSAFAGSKAQMLRYVLDDLSIAQLEMNPDLLCNSTYGIAVANSSKAHEAKEFIKQLAHAGMQTQTIDMSDVVKILKTEGLQEAEDLLTVAEEKKRKNLQEQEMRVKELEKQMQDQMIAAQKEKGLFDRETQVLLLDKKLASDEKQQLMMTMGFNPDKDMDRDGKPDVLEIAQTGIDNNIAMRDQSLKEKQFQHQKETDKKKLELESKKINKQSKK